MLIDTLARYFYDRNINLTLSLSYKLETEIIERFPSEKEVSSIFTVFLTIIIPNYMFYSNLTARIYNKMSNMRAAGRRLKKYCQN